MIDVRNQEQLLTLEEAGALLTKSNGKPVSSCTIWRWIVRGCRGCRLSGVRLGLRWHVKLGALVEFGEELGALGTTPRETGRKPKPKPPTPKDRTEAIEKAKQFCRTRGM